MTGSHLTARDLGLISCPVCHLVSRNPNTTSTKARFCPRCDSPLHSRKPQSITRTWALIIAAIILYVPANLLPITIITTLGKDQTDTIMSGVIYFMQTGMWPIAMVIFIASIFVPLIKIIILITLLISVQIGAQWRPKDRTQLYFITEIIGRWSMVDIYVVTILVALVNFGSIARVKAGPGAIFFGAVVVLTMVAAMSFDPRLIWDNKGEPNESTK